MSEHPLGADTYSPLVEPPVVSVSNGHSRTSIIDTVLDLDELLAQDVRLAQKQAAWYTRPELEATIEQLTSELDAMVDSAGRPLPTLDEDLSSERTPQVVAQELAAVQQEYAASRRYVLMQQLDQDTWDEFQATHKEALTKDPPYPPDFYADLISRCAVRPEIRKDQVPALRKKVGAPAFEELWRVAWAVNTVSGVSIPKSSLSSGVLRQSQLG